MGLSPISGGYGEGETPLPIPNRAVKPLSADGTWPARARESRTPPVYLQSASRLRGGLRRLRTCLETDLCRQGAGSDHDPPARRRRRVQLRLGAFASSAA